MLLLLPLLREIMLFPLILMELKHSIPLRLMLIARPRILKISRGDGCRSCLFLLLARPHRLFQNQSRHLLLLMMLLLPLLLLLLQSLVSLLLQFLLRSQLVLHLHDRMRPLRLRRWLRRLWRQQLLLMVLR